MGAKRPTDDECRELAERLAARTGRPEEEWFLDLQGFNRATLDALRGELRQARAARGAARAGGARGERVPRGAEHRPARHTTMSGGCHRTSGARWWTPA
jgi:hypothetical protein